MMGLPAIGLRGFYLRRHAVDVLWMIGTTSAWDVGRRVGYYCVSVVVNQRICAVSRGYWLQWLGDWVLARNGYAPIVRPMYGMRVRG